MPRSRRKLALTVASLMVSAGCATNSGRPAATDLFRESSSDVTNRAPDSLSVPQSAATGQQIDQFQLRSQADYHFALAESYSLEGNNPRAIEEYKLTLVYDPDSSVVRLRLAAEYVKAGLVSEAIEQAKASLEKDDKNIDARLLLGGLYSALRMYAEAMEQYRAVLLQEPENPEAPMFVGALLAEQKRYDEAVKTFEALARNKNNKAPHLAWYYVGRITLEEGKDGSRQRAEKAYQQALSLKPEFTDAVVGLGQIYEASNRRKMAKDLYVAYQEKYGPDNAIAEPLGRLHFEDEEFDKALRQFEVIEAREDENLNVKVKMAFILIEKKQFSEAIIKLEEILARAPQSDKIRFYLGAVYEEIKDYRNAISQFRKIPVGSSYYSEAIVHSAYLHKVLGDYSEAVKVVEDGINNQPDHAQFYALFASFLDDMKEYDRAAKMLSGAVAKFPEHAQLHFFLGSMQDRLGDTEKTVRSMRRVLEIDRDHVQALNYLAYTFAEQGKNLDEAEKLVRRALELQPGDGYILDTLGWVLLKKGQLSDAIKTLEAAYKAQPAESIIAEHLGDAYYRYQLPEKAKRMYQKAAEIETNQETIRKIRDKIASVEQQMQSVGNQRQQPRDPASER